MSARLTAWLKGHGLLQQTRRFSFCSGIERSGLAWVEPQLRVRNKGAWTMLCQRQADRCRKVAGTLDRKSVV